jgi:hypothetical protein
MSFTNPVPPGSIVTQIDAAASLSSDISEVYFDLNDNYAGDSIPYAIANGVAAPSDQCHFVRVDAPGIKYKDGVPSLWTGNDLFISAWFVEWVDLTFHYDPPPTIEFELDSSVPEQQRRVLLHVDPSDTNYFSDAQKRVSQDSELRDSRIEIKARMLQGATPVADRAMYFRVYDPPDPSPYVKPFSGEGDNYAVASLAAKIGDLPINHVQTDQDGYARIIMTVPPHSAGDNFQIDASPFPFPFGGSTDCTAAKNCYRSATITSWKRTYVETDVMFREGAFLVQDVQPAAPGADQTVIVTECRPFKRGSAVYFIHGPHSTVLNDGFYAETSSIAQVKRIHGTQNCLLTLAAPLVHNYYGPDGGMQHLADGVGVLGTDPFFVPNTSLVAHEFANAFVDFVIDPVNVNYAQSAGSDPLSIVPHIDDLGSESDPAGTQPGGEVEHRLFALKWSFNPSRLNSLHIIGGDYDFTNPAREGVTWAGDGAQYTYLFVGAMEGLFNGRGAYSTANALNGELTVHEVAHNWHVNPGGVFGGDGDHCEHQNWEKNGTCTGGASSSIVITDDSTVPPREMFCLNTACPEWYDGRVEFHAVTRFDSEYMYIRWRDDPLPLDSRLNSIPAVP